MEFPDFLNAGTWISLLTLSFLEIVLGVDNIIFISIITNRLPEEKQRRVRTIGLLLAMGFRLCLLLAISWIIGLKAVVLTLGFINDPDGGPLQLSYKDIILICGGLFLIVKSTLEIHHKLQKQMPQTNTRPGASAAMGAILLQIVAIDAVFSFDSILTAVGLVDSVFIMMLAVVISIAIMLLFAGKVSRIINANPTLQMLALSFLVVIGVMLVTEGVHQHISKSIIYSCLCFSLAVELLNIRLRKKQEKVEGKDSV